LINEFGIGIPSYTSREEILDNHRSVLCSFRISTKDGELDIPSLYWILKLHKCPYKQCYIAGSVKCSTKTSFLIINISSILSAVKSGL